MKRTIEISASFTGTIPTGSYENEKPFYSIKEILELESNEEIDSSLNLTQDIDIKQRQKELHQICYDQFKAQADVSFRERLAKTYKDIRFYDGIDGKQYPSVTSIINMDKDFHIPPDELTQYACRGTIIHKQVELFLSSKDEDGKNSFEWKAPQDIEECSHEYLTVVKGSLGLDIENTNFQAFYKAYPFEVINLEETILSPDFEYGGRMDILCKISSENKGKWEKIEGVVYDEPTILDIKTSTSLDKISGLTQQSAYAQATNVKQIGLIHLNKDVKQGFSTPAITTNTGRYWNLFLNKRELFKARYGI
jgi:hypothetical protein